MKVRVLLVFAAAGVHCCPRLRVFQGSSQFFGGGFVCTHDLSGCDFLGHARVASTGKSVSSMYEYKFACVPGGIAYRGPPYPIAAVWWVKVSR